MYIILTEKNMGEISKNLEEGMTSFVSRALENSYSLVMGNAVITSSNGNSYTINFKKVPYENIKSISTQSFSVNDTVKILANKYRNIYSDIIIIGKTL